MAVAGGLIGYCCRLLGEVKRKVCAIGWKRGSAAILAVMILVAAGCASVSVDFDSCDHTAAREATIAVGDASGVRVIARAGSLRIDGSPGLSDIKARGTACASSQDGWTRWSLSLGDQTARH